MIEKADKYTIFMVIITDLQKNSKKLKKVVDKKENKC